MSMIRTVYCRVDLLGGDGLEKGGGICQGLIQTAMSFVDVFCINITTPSLL